MFFLETDILGQKFKATQHVLNNTDCVSWWGKFLEHFQNNYTVLAAASKQSNR